MGEGLKRARDAARATRKQRPAAPTPSEQTGGAPGLTENEALVALASAARDYPEARWALDELHKTRAQVEEWVEREAAVCPEDVGFEEFIASLRAQVARLEGERDRAINLVGQMSEEADRLVAAQQANRARLSDALAASEREGARLRAALEKYGEHRAHCDVGMGPGRECSCGLLAALAASPTGRPSDG